MTNVYSPFFVLVITITIYGETKMKPKLLENDSQTRKLSERDWKCLNQQS